MSVYYTIYLEAKINGQWHLINSKVPQFNKNIKKAKDTICCSYFNGSRSYFNETQQKLSAIGYECSFSDLSPELKELYPEAVKNEKNPDNSWFPDPNPILIDYKTFKNYIKPNQYDYHGLVHKDKIIKWNNGEIEDLYPEEHEVLASLIPEEKQCYEYIEWDDPFGWNTHFKEINFSVINDITRFEKINSIWDDSTEYRLILIYG